MPEAKHFITAIAVLGFIFGGLFVWPRVMVSPEETRRVLTSAGYKEIQIGGYAWFACDKNDTFATSFTATASSGQRVAGAVCSGFLKGHTIRYD